MSKGQQPMVGARVPHSWKKQIDDLTKTTGKIESDIVREALAHYLDRTDIDSVDSLMKRVATLERQMKKLTQIVTS
jgi:predicted DNA-binding protein